MNCWLCDKEMGYLDDGITYCYSCHIVYSDGSYYYSLGKGVPYIISADLKRYTMDEWDKYLKLKAFW